MLYHSVRIYPLIFKVLLEFIAFWYNEIIDEYWVLWFVFL